MTAAGFLIALGGSVLLISAMTLFVGTLTEVFSGPLSQRNGDFDLSYYDEPPEVHDLPVIRQAHTMRPVADVVGGP